MRHRQCAKNDRPPQNIQDVQVVFTGQLKNKKLYGILKSTNNLQMDSTDTRVIDPIVPHNSYFTCIYRF